MWVEVTRRARFSAARRLARRGWSEARNESVYGRSARRHGHDFTLDVTVGGEVSEETGMVVDLKNLKALIARHVIDALDHRDLDDVELLKGWVPTDENLVMAIWRQLSGRLGGGHRLVELTLRQGADRAVSCRGE
jgi:6-pyruvoyltetrahydropterin/6-carboxytetrahydropterin synthase